MTRFYLGTHQPSWFALTGVPLFVARQRLDRRGRPGQWRLKLPEARGRWCLDSGGFNEVHRGGWSITASQYVEQVQRARDEIGKLDWAAPLDWMCEDTALKATGLTIKQHQRLTVDNLVELRTLDPTLPIIPVLQGYSIDDYRRCADMYDRAGIDLTTEPTVGLGSVCRRQATSEIEAIAREFHGWGMRLHGFGVKSLGLARYAHMLQSADSLAWSSRGYRVMPCAHGPNRRGQFAANEANCLPFALAWREDRLAQLAAVDTPSPFG